MKATEWYRISDTFRSLYFHAPTLQIFSGPKVDSGLETEELENFRGPDLSTVGTTIVEENPGPEYRQVILPVSASCNLDCPYCFARVDGKFGFEDFTADGLIHVIDRLHETEERVNLVFFGGEPMLRPDLIATAVNYTRKTYSDWDVGFSITTNGTVYKAEFSRFLADNRIPLLVSTDGPGGYRPWKNGASSFGTVMDNVKRYRDDGLDLSLRATLTSSSEDVVTTYDYFERLDLPFSVVFAYKSANQRHNLSDYGRALDSLKHEMNGLVDYYTERFMSSTKVYCTSLLDKLQTLRFRLSRRVHCSGGRSMFSVLSDGSLYTCEHLIHDGEYSVGNILDEDMDKVKLEQFRAHSLEELQDCAGCMIRNLCNGGCFSQKLLTGRTVFQRLSLDDCELLRLQWNAVIRLFGRLSSINLEK